jgi:hypothetical protein
MTTAVLERKDDDVDAETQKRQGEARDIFYAFRIMMHPIQRQ